MEKWIPLIGGPHYLSTEFTIYDIPFHLDLQKLVLQERLDLLQHAQVINMEKQHISIFKQEIVKK
jgi:hypothetical protein